LVAGGYGLRAATDSPHETAARVAEVSTPAAASNGEPAGDVSSLVQRAQQSVVRVTSRVTQFGPFGQPVTGEAVGTGFVVTSEGLIVTNAHVVENSDDITVTLADGRQYRATLVQMDSPADLAVLDIDQAGLPTLALADSSEVLAGQSVVAIGFALGLEGSPTVTTGIVSSTGRTIQVADGPMIRTYRDVFQISAAINAGNSGGPLLDLQGRVIGINTAGAQGADNIGFAIPIDQAKALIDAAS
jgi:S1-C subfamily serine protease